MILIIFSAQLCQKLSFALIEVSEELTSILLISFILSSSLALRSGLNVSLIFGFVGFNTTILNHFFFNISLVLALISPLGSVTIIEQLSRVKIFGIIYQVVFHHQVRAIKAKCSKLCLADNLFLSPSNNNHTLLLLINFLISFFDKNSASLLSFLLLYPNSTNHIVLYKNLNIDFIMIVNIFSINLFYIFVILGSFPDSLQNPHIIPLEL
ncbi:MAG: hypothetical protein U9N59_01615 [Campylobacterota bacterium]|nr:hypothetical protein [Campylobacterota bacterium]